MVKTSTFSHQHELEWLSSILEVSCGKLSCDKEEIPVLKTGNGTSIRGFITIAKYLVQSSKHNHLCGVDPADKAAISQWLEYCENVVARSVHEKDTQTLLKEINYYLADKVYFVGYKLSIADLILYFGLYHIMKEQAFYEKQAILHSCRWFDNVQNQISRRPSELSILPFQKNKLYSDFEKHH